MPTLAWCSCARNSFPQECPCGAWGLLSLLGLTKPWNQFWGGRFSVLNTQ